MEIPPNNQQPVEEKKPSTALKIGVLVALIALLVIGILLPIKLVPNAISTVSDKISSIFGSKNTATLSTNMSEIDSGVPFTLSWTGTHETNGTYMLSYSCTNGVHFETSVNQPNETIGCDSQYVFSPTDNSIVLTPYGTASAASNVSLNLSFLATGASAPQNLGQLSLTIVNNSIAASSTEATTTSPTVSSSPSPSPTPSQSATTTSQSTSPVVTETHQVSNPNGIADLSVTVVNVGYLDPATSQFVPSQYVYGNQRAAVKFIIKNTGTKNTGSWNFTAMLPSATNPTYTSRLQQNLGPGDSIQYVLGFDNINSAQNNTISITADPSGLVRESSKANNTATANIVNLQGNGYSVSGINNYQADLAVSIVAVGTLDKNTNAFYPSTNNNYFNPSDRVGVQFKVTNIGGGSSGQWQFGATLPSLTQNQQYTSDYQNSLAQGQSTIITIGFDNLANSGPNTFSVQVDPNHQINQTSTSNDSASIVLYRY